MKKLIMLALCLAGGLGKQLYGQKKLNEYSAYVQYKVALIAQTSQLAEEKQFKIAHYFDQREEQVKEMIVKGEAGSKLSLFYATEDFALQKLLTAQEFASYMAGTRNSSLLLDAITMEKALALNDDTIRKLLLAYNDELSITHNLGPEMKDWEESRLAEHLSKDQLSAFIKLKEQSNWFREARLKWQILDKWKLAKGVDSNQFKQEYIDFQLKRGFLMATLTGERETARKDSIDRYLQLLKPFLIRKLEMYENTPPSKSQFSELINYRLALKLSNEQIDSLVNRASNLFVLTLDYKKKHQVTKYPAVSYEQDGMSHILTRQQLNDFLVMKYKPQAEDEAINIWEELKKNNLATGINEQTALKDIADYQLNVIVAKKKGSITNSKDAAYQQKMVEAAKPEILVMLAEKKDVNTINKEVKRKMAW